jgi:hypothetical protein
MLRRGFLRFPNATHNITIPSCTEPFGGMSQRLEKEAIASPIAPPTAAASAPDAPVDRDVAPPAVDVDGDMAVLQSELLRLAGRLARHRVTTSPAPLCSGASRVTADDPAPLANVIEPLAVERDQLARRLAEAEARLAASQAAEGKAMGERDSLVERLATVEVAHRLLEKQLAEAVDRLARLSGVEFECVTLRERVKEQAAKWEQAMDKLKDAEEERLATQKRLDETLREVDGLRERVVKSEDESERHKCRAESAKKRAAKLKGEAKKAKDKMDADRLIAMARVVLEDGARAWSPSPAPKASSRKPSSHKTKRRSRKAIPMVVYCYDCDMPVRECPRCSLPSCDCKGSGNCECSD